MNKQRIQIFLYNQNISNIKHILDNISKQQYDNFSVIIQDNGKKDLSFDFCRMYAKKQIIDLTCITDDFQNHIDKTANLYIKINCCKLTINNLNLLYVISQKCSNIGETDLVSWDIKTMNYIDLKYSDDNNILISKSYSRLNNQIKTISDNIYESEKQIDNFLKQNSIIKKGYHQIHKKNGINEMSYNNLNGFLCDKPLQSQAQSKQIKMNVKKSVKITKLIKNKSNLLSKDDIRKSIGNSKINIAFTSWKKRITNCVKVIKNILNNTIQPDKIYLSLSIAEFKNKEKDLPVDLVNLSKTNSKVIINWVDGPNTKCFKKIFPILKYLNDDDIIIDIDDDAILPNDFIQARITDFVKNDCKYSISSNTHYPFIEKIHSVWAFSLMTKKMLNNWEYIVNDEVIKSGNDTAIISMIIYFNGYDCKKCTKYSVKEIIARYTYNDNVKVSKKKSDFISSQDIRYKKLINKILNKYGITTIPNSRGFLKKDRRITNMQSNVEINKKYIDYYRTIYNIGDLFSDYLFDCMYDKNILNNIKERKLLRFIGSEIPTKGWMNKNTYFCGMGWRLKTAKLDPLTVNPENFCYTRGKISRNRVIESGVKISKDLPIGDTGLLASFLYKPTISDKKFDICILTHFSDAKNIPIYKNNLLSINKNFKIVCVSMGDKNYNCTKLFEIISQSKLVLSSSLHGIIFSHSFGTPVLYFASIDGVKIVDSYKFEDYYSIYDQIKYDFSYTKNIFSSVIKNIFDEKYILSHNPSFEQVKTICLNIIKAFPYKEAFTQIGKDIEKIISESVQNKVYILEKPVKNKKSVGLVAIARLENNYINEWIAHHLKKGFNHIYIYDNSFNNEQHIDQVIKNEYVDKVTVIPVYNKTAYQKTAYNHAYQTFGKNHDYMMFEDVDEFVSLLKHKTIQEYLDWIETIRPNVESIRIHWDIYDDNNLITRDISKSIVETFTRRGTTQTCKFHNTSTKCLIKTKIKDMFFPSVHFSRSKTKKLITVNGSGDILDPNITQMISNRKIDVIKINHYVTKTISEYMNQKLKRGDADGYITRTIDNRFFVYCEKTQEKMKYYLDHKND